MIIYNLSLERQNILGADKFSVAADANKTVGFRFHFDRSWRIFDTKAAVFKDSMNKYYALDIASDSVIVPWEVLRDTNGFDLAVVAYENEVVMTSRKVHIDVCESLLPEFCRQLTPTESLFDRIIADARIQASAEQKNYINELKQQYTQTVTELNRQIDAERQNAEFIEAQKNAEIELINQQIADTEAEHQAEIQELENELSAKTELADKWELVDNAAKHKTAANQALWTGGTELYALPIIDLSSLTSMNNFGFSSYITEAGFKLDKIGSIEGAFSYRGNLKKIILQNTENITSAKSAFEYCGNLKYADVGNLTKCTSFNNIFDSNYNLEEISIGYPQSITSMYRAFYDCSSLERINGVFNNVYCTYYHGAFINCISLKEIRFKQNSIISGLDMGDCRSLSKESFYNIADGLNSESPSSLVLSNNAFRNNLTEEEQSEITNIVRNTKGWTLSLN